MTRRFSFLLLKWLVVLGALGGVCVGSYLVHLEMVAEREKEGNCEKVKSPRRARDGVVDLGVEMAGRLGLKEEPARVVQWSHRVPVYGRVMPNPRAMSEVRSPFPGTLRAAPKKSWPGPGQWVQSGEVLGWVDVRLGPEVRLALQNTLNDARHKYQGTQEILKLREDRVARLKNLESGQGISRKDLDQALVSLADAKTQAATAKASVGLYEKALAMLGKADSDKDSPWRQPLIAPADGEVTQLLGQPGMAIEAGGGVLQIVDFRRPLVKLDFPPQFLSPGPPPRITLYAHQVTSPESGILDQPESGKQSRQAEAILVGPTSQVDLSSQLVPYWYEIEKVPSPGTAKPDTPREGPASPRNALWRPGLLVKTEAKDPSIPPKEAVSVPESAVLFHQGRALVYVRRGPGRFERREVRLLGREGDCWALALRGDQVGKGVSEGEAVVSKQGQVLLSEEFRGDLDND